MGSKRQVMLLMKEPVLYVNKGQLERKCLNIFGSLQLFLGFHRSKDKLAVVEGRRQCILSLTEIIL